MADSDTAAVEDRQGVPPAADTPTARSWHQRAAELQVRLRALQDEGIDEIDNGEGLSRNIAQILDEDWLTPHGLDLTFLERLTAATEARASEGAEAEPAAPTIQPTRRHELSGAITRPCYELLMHLRDAHVEQVGDPAQPGASWRVREALERLDKHLVSRQELLRISEAAEAAALLLPRSAAERRADSREDGKRRGRLIARLKQLAADGVSELGGAPTEYLRQVVPQMGEEQLARVEALAFPAVESQPQDEDAVGALAVGSPDDVADALDELSDEGKAGTLREAIQRIEELEGLLTTAQADLAEAVRRASTREAELLDEIARLRATATAEASPPPAADLSSGDDPAWDRTDPKLLNPYLDFIGLLPDVEIAAMACVEEATVATYRQVHSIAARWRDEEVAEAPPLSTTEPRALVGVPEQLRLAGLLVGMMSDREVRAVTGQPAKALRELRRQLNLPAGPDAQTADQLAEALRSYAALDLVQIADDLHVPSGDRLVERLALELTGRVW